MKYIIANWKTNMTEASIQEWTASFVTPDVTDTQIILAPTEIYLKELANQQFTVCAQNISIYEDGAHTGETSVKQLKDFCKYALVGHTETGDDLQTKVIKRDLCLKYGITPIICFTTSAEAAKLSLPGCILAWEAQANISTEGTFVQLNMPEIINILAEINAVISADIPVLYGGSVNRQNIQKLANIKTIAGVLVGHASEDPVHFAELITALQN